MCKIGVHEFSFGVENFELRGGVFMPFISRPCLDWGREKKINCQKKFNFFFYPTMHQQQTVTSYEDTSETIFLLLKMLCSCMARALK